MKHTTARTSVPAILLLILLGIANFAVLFLNYSAHNVYADTTWLDGWSYRRELTVDHTLIDADLTDFPVLVKLNSASFDFTKAQNDGEDVRFTSSDGTTLLKYEIERWDHMAEQAGLWVKLPSVSSASDTDFYLYYGNSTVSDAQDPANVWDGSFMMVQHLEETSGAHNDSTSNKNNSTIVNVTTQGSAAGKIGGADEFVRASSNYVTIGDSQSINLTTYTLELWFNADDASVATQSLLGRGEDWTNDKAQYVIEIDDAQNPDRVQLWYEEADDADHYFPSTTSISSGTWYYVAASRDQSTGRVIVYLQGNSERDVVDATTPWSGPTPLEIGCRRNDGGTPVRQDYFDGIIDEVRISNTPRTAAWIKASYHSEDDSLLAYGGEETFTSTPTYLNIATNTTRAGYPCEFQAKWTDPDGLDTCLFTTNNTGTWQANQTIAVSGTESWANTTLTLNSTADLIIGYRWYCNDTLGNMGDTGIQTLTTTSYLQYTMKLWFNNTAIAENLVDFPVMINLSRAGTHFWSHTDPDHKDLRFFDADSSTELYFEIEDWNYADWKAHVWVKVPQIDASSSTDFIYLYYGLPGTSESAYHSPTQVWDSNFVMVQHLEEPSGTVTDSTSYGNDGTYNGATQDVTGKIDGADEFDGDYDYVQISHAESLNLGTGDFTISVWVKYGPDNDDSDILRKGCTQDTPPNNYKLELSSNRIAGNLYDGGNSRVETTATYSDNNWHFVVFRRETGNMYLYVDGGLEASATGAGRNVSNTAYMCIGSKDYPYLEDFFTGIIDEVRISNMSRTTAWMKVQYLSMNDENVTFTRAPNKPTNPNPPDGATCISISPILSVNVTDPDGDAMDVYFYQAGTEAEAPENFTIIVLPDTQYYSESYPVIFSNQTQWIVDNAESMNILFVTHEGDIVEHWNVATEWDNANSSMSILNGHVPYGFCAGNHDEESSGPNTDWIGDNYFPESRYATQNWWIDGYVQNKNNAQNFSTSDMAFMVVHIEYQANSTTLDWANSTLQYNSEKRAIITTHNYLESSGSRTTWGQTLWDDIIVPNDNVFMVLCGHVGAEARRTDTINDRTVHQMLANYQGRTNGGNGWLRTLEFCPAQNKIYVETYSPYLGSYETDADSEFTLDYNMTGSAPGPSLIGLDTNVPSGGVASVEWTGLNYSTTYRWYAIAVDTHGATTQSDTWKFTTLFAEAEDLMGDANGDGCVDGLDYILFVAAYGSEEGASNWDERCDFNIDKKVDVQDLFIISRGYGKCRRGDGVLYIYTGGSEVERNADGNYQVYPGATYNFTIADITEYENMQISVWARYFTDQAYNILVNSSYVGLKPSNITFTWTVPSNLPVTTSIKFKYGTCYQGPIGAWYYARKDVSPAPRLLLVVPEAFLGSLGALIALFLGFKLKTFIRRRRRID